MKKILMYVSVLVLAITASCSDDYLDVNTDQNNPVSVSPDLILSPALVYSAESIENRINGQRMTNTLGNMLMYNWSQSDGYAWYDDEFKYNVTSSFYSGIWTHTYLRALKQYQLLVENNNANMENYQAIGRIMKSFHFQTLVDLYGDVPYFQALQRGSNTSPAFDDGLEIYEDLIIQLNAAIDLIDSATADTVVPGADDVMFGGDMTAWKQFANTVKARILVRQIDMPGRATYVNDEFVNINNEGSGYITADALVNPGYVSDIDKQNPKYGTLGKDTDGNFVNNHKATSASDYVINHLMNTSDDRIDYIYETPATGHLGLAQGILNYPDDTTEEFVSNLGPGILKGDDQGAVIFSLAELKFILAEAALKSMPTGTPGTLYNEGIEASFNYLGAPGASAYYGQNIENVNYSFSTDKEEAIITQKWIALNSINAIESWFDYNRTGYPANLPISRLASTSDRPVRLEYPATEISTNPNVPEQPDAFTQKIFWAN